VRTVAWKRHYREELARPDARASVTDWLAAPAERRLLEGVDRGGIISFPHTRLAASGPIDAAIVSTLYEREVDRIVALGVLHSGGSRAYRIALDEDAPEAERASAFDVVRGAFTLEAARIETPFGLQPVEPSEEVPGLLRVDRASLLRGEFSLDTFASILRRGADVLGKGPIPLVPVYVGMMRHPVTGSFELAREAAAWLRDRVSSSTAVVATGDLVHYGTAYGTLEASASDEHDLVETLRSEVEATLALALVDRKLDAAYHRSKEVLMNDQREILPVIVETVAPSRRFEVLRFDLTDYADVLAAPRPCVVASALVIYG